MVDLQPFQEGAPYTDPEIYEPVRYQGLYGRYKEWREKRLLKAFLDKTQPGQSLLDCPAGVGRLFATFQHYGLNIVGADLSLEMLEFAKSRASGNMVGLMQMRAGHLALTDNAIDWVFSFALMKHLSPDVQMATLSEFSRVARKGVVASFAIIQPMSFPRWWFRSLKRRQSSFPIPELWLQLAACRLRIHIQRLGRVVPGLGLETVYLFTPGRPRGDRFSGH